MYFRSETSTSNSVNVKINNYVYTCIKICANKHNLRKFASYSYLVILISTGKIPRSQRKSIMMPFYTLLLRTKRNKGSARYLSIIYIHDVSTRNPERKHNEIYVNRCLLNSRLKSRMPRIENERFYWKKLGRDVPFIYADNI